MVVWGGWGLVCNIYVGERMTGKTESFSVGQSNSPCYPAHPSVFLRIWQMMEPKQRQYIWQSKERRFIFLKYDSQPEATEELLM